jgi:predicted GNAT family acetyltransferase
MAEITVELDEKKRGAFNLYVESEKAGEMVVSISGNNLMVYHTEINPEATGHGYAKQLLDTMVTYARENQLLVIPLCQYVLAQFNRHPDDYRDVWNQQGTS